MSATRNSKPSTTFLVLLLTAAAPAGCQRGDRPQTARVQGVVKLDGKPLEKATVVFIPESGRPASGVTDAGGKYELMYTQAVPGASLGEHTIRVSTYLNEEGEDGTTQTTPELIPIQYNHQSELKGTVVAGRNEINLDLNSRGQIIQSN